MAYTPTEWKDHIVQHPNRFRVIDNGDGTVDILDEHGEILQQGTPVNAANLNKMEQGIKDAHDAIATHLNENVQADQPHGIVIEEGEWTPYYQPSMGEFGNIEYSEQYGYYYRNNKFVYVFGYLSVNGITFDKGNANGGLRIAGLPFNPARAIYFTASRFFRWGTNDETIGIYFRAEHSYLIIKKIVKPNFFYKGIPDDNIYVDDMLLSDNTHINYIAFSGIYTI